MWGIQKNGAMNLFLGQEQRHKHKEQTCGHRGQGERTNWAIRTDTAPHTTVCKVDSWWELAIKRRRLCVREEGNGKSKRDRTYAYLWVTHFIVEQRLTQHCKSNYTPNKNKV